MVIPVGVYILTPEEDNYAEAFPFLMVYRINYAGLRDPRLLQEVGDLTTANHSKLMT